MKIIQRMAHRTNYGGTRKASDIKYIVLHYTGNTRDTASANASYFANNANLKASAHYFVDGTDCYQSVPDLSTAYSVGRNFGTGNLFATVKNANSISIEMCSAGGYISASTVKQAQILTRELMKKYKISADHVYRHYDVCSKQCPGWSGWLPPSDSKWKSFKAGLVDSKPSTASSGFVVSILADSLNIRTGPGTSYKKVGSVTQGDAYTIVETSGNWGKLKSGAGWISILSKYVKRI